MKKILLLCACLLALAAPPRAVAGPPAIIVVRIYEGNSTVRAIITRGEGQSEQIRFDKGTGDKRMVQSSEGYHQLFQRLYQEGYSLQSTMSAPNSPDSGFTTLLFVKVN